MNSNRSSINLSLKATPLAHQSTSRSLSGSSSSQASLWLRNQKIWIKHWEYLELSKESTCSLSRWFSTLTWNSSEWILHKKLWAKPVSLHSYWRAVVSWRFIIAIRSEGLRLWGMLKSRRKMKSWCRFYSLGTRRTRIILSMCFTWKN
jgi:hypothetical protein